MSVSTKDKGSKKASTPKSTKDKDSSTKSNSSKKELDAANASIIKSTSKKSDAIPGQRVPVEKSSKSNKRQHDVKKTKDKEKKKKPVKKAKGLYESFFLFFGYYVGPIKLTDPYALEAVQALNLSTWNLRKLKAKFDAIDLDGSGAIDYDEFFEAVGEMRSPFTDKLFALIGILVVIGYSY